MIKALKNARGITADASGTLYVSVGEPDMQVVAFNTKGPSTGSGQAKETGRFGRKGGHARIGAWQPDGMIDPAGIAVDKEGKLWVMEHYAHPKRVSVWNLKDGALVRDFFGPTQYGASGAAIDPRDPNLMVGVGCEWRLDPVTGKSVCLGAFDNTYHEFATFREGSNGKLYLFTLKMRYGIGSVQVWERRGDAKYVLCAEIRNDRGGSDNNKPGTTEVWVDLNGDGKEQPEEVQRRDGALHFDGSNSWSLNLGPESAWFPASEK